MDMNQIGQLLHIHKEALAHGPMFSNIAAAAMHALREHEAEAKEEMIHIREEQKAKEADEAERAAEMRANEDDNRVDPDVAVAQRDRKIEDDKAAAAAHAETMRKANTRINPGSDGPKVDPALVQTEQQPTVLDRRL